MVKFGVRGPASRRLAWKATVSLRKHWVHVYNIGDARTSAIANAPAIIVILAQNKRSHLFSIIGPANESPDSRLRGRRSMSDSEWCE